MKQSQVIFSDVPDIKEITDVNLEKYIETQKKALRLAQEEMDYHGKDLSSYITATTEDLSTLRKERKRRENFREFIDWNNPKEKPESDERVLIYYYLSNTAFAINPGCWRKKKKCWNINGIKGNIPDKGRCFYTIVGWAKMLKGPKTAFEKTEGGK